MKRAPHKIFIISGPSGAGEDSVIEELQRRLKFNRVITTVTRQPRGNESQGNPYYFVSVAEFKNMIAAHELVEWAVVYDDYRGCTKKEIERLLQLPEPIFWKVDWQGVRTIKQSIPEAISIFIMPPSYEVLEQRILKRGQNTMADIKRREEFTRAWLQHKDVYDYVVVNEEGKFGQTVEKVEAIIRSKITA